MCCSCCIFKYWARLSDAIDATDAAMDFLSSTKRIILVPILFFVLQAAVVVGWLWIFIATLSSSGVIPLEIAGVSIPQAKTFAMNWTEMLPYVVYLTFGLFWVTSFLHFYCEFITSYAACSYYFDSNKNYDGEPDLAGGFASAFKH